MRRKLRLGVYSSHTIKRCYCKINENISKAMNSGKLQTMGNGKIEKNKVFIQFDKHNHKKHSNLRYFRYKEDSLRKRDLKALSNEMEKEAVFMMQSSIGLDSYRQ